MNCLAMLDNRVRCFVAVLTLVSVGLPWKGVAAKQSAIEGIYTLRLGQSREEALAALSQDQHFRRIPGRHYSGFPLYEVQLGEYQLRIRPIFADGQLAEITLRFRQTASPNDVTPVILDRLRFGLETLTARFGPPDQVHLHLASLDRRDFRERQRVLTHEWLREERRAGLALWQDGFTYGAEIILALHNQSGSSTVDSAAEAF